MSKNDVCREVEIVTLNATVRVFSTAKEDTLNDVVGKALVLFEKFREGN